MTLRELVVRAVTERDPVLAGKVANVLQFRFGANYKETYEFVNGIKPIPLAEWDGLLYEADTMGE